MHVCAWEGHRRKRKEKRGGNFRGDSDFWRKVQKSSMKKNDGTVEKRKGKMVKISEKMMLKRMLKIRATARPELSSGAALQNNSVIQVSSYGDRWTKQIHITNLSVLPTFPIVDHSVWRDGESEVKLLKN